MFAVIGNPTFDLIRTPQRSDKAIGGGVTYATLTLLSLGERVSVWGKGDRNIQSFLRNQGADVSCFQPTLTCTFENIYESGERRQRAQLGEAFREEEIPKDIPCSAVLYTPVLCELQDVQCSRRGTSLSAVDLQGFMRHLAADGSVSLSETHQTWEAVRLCDVVKLDNFEAAALTCKQDPQEALHELLEVAKGMVLLTMAERGAYLGAAGKAWRIRPPNVDVLDATGAGDVALAAFISEFLKTSDPLHAARYSTCAASLSVEGFGLSGIPIPALVQDRLTEVKCEETIRH